jgi:6-bladed beta-propeller
MLKPLSVAKDLIALGALCACARERGTPTAVTISSDRPFADFFELVRNVRPEQTDSALIGTVTHLAIAPDGRILITDGQAGSVFLFSPAGSLRKVIGRSGDGPGEYRSAFRSQFASQDRIAVLDMALRRIQVFDTLGALKQTLTVEQYGRPNDMAVLRDGTYLLTTVDPADERVLVHLSAIGTELWRALAIAGEVPDGEEDGPVWQGARFYSIAIRADTVWVVSTLRSTLWQIPIDGGSPQRLDVSFKGYLAPNLPPPSAGQLSAWEYFATKHFSALLQVGKTELYWPFIQGQPYEDGPHMLVRRDGRGRWSVYDSVPMVVACVGDTLVAVRNPGTDEMRLEFYHPREAGNRD